MKIHTSHIFATTVWFLACCTTPAIANSDPLDPFSPTKLQTLETYHQAGLNNDNSYTPEMIRVLQTHTSPMIRKTVLLALARLKATEAVPAIDPLMLPASGEETQNFARASRAYLLAGTETTPHAQAERFFREIGETPAQLNGSIQTYMEGSKAHKLNLASPMREVTAEMELADLIYHGATQALLADPLVAQVDFSLFYSPRVKIEMARLPPEQQRQVLVDRLAHADVWGETQRCEAQILVDLGRDQAAQAVSDKLREMEGHSEGYQEGGFKSLLNVVYTLESSEGGHPASFWDHYLHHSDPKIKPAAEAAHNHPESNVFVLGY